MKKLVVFFAHPYFNDAQRESSDAVKEILVSLDFVDIYDAFHLLPNIENDNRHLRDILARWILRSNVEGLKKADIVVALINDLDTGVIWELGYAYARGIPIIAITDKHYGLNIMIRECVDLFINNVLSPTGRKLLEDALRTHYIQKIQLGGER